MKRGTRLRSRGARAKREAEAVKRFGEVVRSRPRCERCGFVPLPGMEFHAHHLVPRSRGAGWKYLHDADVNGAALCAICHGHVHEHRVKDWARWLLTLEQGRARAEVFGQEGYRADYDLVVGLSWVDPDRMTVDECRLLSSGVGLVIESRTTLSAGLREVLEEMDRRLNP